MLEDNYPNHRNKDEEELRDEIVQCVKMVFKSVHSESKKAKGKRDITIKDNYSDFEL